MTKSKKPQAAAAAALLAAGFEPSSKLGALLRRLTGRSARFVKPGTALRVTVGRITTCFYEVVNGKTRHLVDVPTKRTRRIALIANHSEARLLGYRFVTSLETVLRPELLPITARS